MLHFLRLRALLVVLCCIAISCEDEDDVPDTAGPVITIETPTNGSKVKGTIEISVKAEDVSNAVTLRLYVDNNLIKEEASKELVATLDTKTLTEGLHNIEVKAVDDKENASSKTSTFEIRNTLFTLAVPNGYAASSASLYVVLSRNDGSLIGWRKLENGTTLSIPTPDDFNLDSSFVYTEYFHLNETNLLINVANIYAGIEVGDYKLPKGRGVGPVIGTHQLNVTSVPTSHTAVISGSHVGSIMGSFGHEGFINRELDLTNTSSDLFFSVVEDRMDAPRYKYIETIQSGGSTTFSATGLPLMDKQTIALGSLVSSYDAGVTGYPANSDVGTLVSGIYSTEPASELSFYYPGSSFTRYRTHINTTIDNVTYTKAVTAATPPSTVEYLDAEITGVAYADGKLNVISSGEFDVAMVSAGTSTYEDNLFTLNTYSIFFPSERQKIVIPQLPQEILEFGLPSIEQFEFNNMLLADYEGVSGLLDYQQKLVFSSDGQFRFHRDGLLKGSSVVPISGGRLSSPTPRFREEIKVLKKRFPQIIW